VGGGPSRRSSRSPALRCSWRSTTSPSTTRATSTPGRGADSGLYTKLRVRVASLGAGPDGILAWTYVLNDYEGGLPSARYLGVMADAAERAGAPDDYVGDLRIRPSRSIGT